jgi:hypothetical protein
MVTKQLNIFKNTRVESKRVRDEGMPQYKKIRIEAFFHRSIPMGVYFGVNGNSSV